MYLELGPLYIQLANKRIEGHAQDAQHFVIQAKGCAEKIAVLNTRLEARRFNSQSTDLERNIKHIESKIRQTNEKTRTPILTN